MPKNAEIFCRHAACVNHQKPHYSLRHEMQCAFQQKQGQKMSPYKEKGFQFLTLLQRFLMLNLITYFSFKQREDIFLA